MPLNSNAVSVLSAALVGVAAGYIGGPVYILIPWAIMGLALGALSGTRGAALLLGGVFGFAASYVFVIHGYAGAQPLVTRLAPFLIFGLIGAVPDPGHCGLRGPPARGRPVAIAVVTTRGPLARLRCAPPRALGEVFAHV
jgi:hypothetical protein